MFKKLQLLLLALFLPLCGLLAHGVQLRWNIVPSTGAIRVWVEHWHGNASNVNGFPLVVSYTINGTTTQQTYYATGYVNNSGVSGLPDGGNTSTLLSQCLGRANNENNWVYWDFNPPACNTPVTLNIIAGTAATTTEGCSNLYPQTIISSFNDNTGPAITCNDLLVAPQDPNACSAVVSNFGITAVDACGGNVTTTYSIAEGSTFPLGITPVTVTSTDQYNNSNTCTFNVTVGDQQPATVITQPVTVALVNGAASVTATDVDNGSFDNACGGIASMTVSPSTFDCSNLGVNTVTLTVTDISGNVSTGTATVTVTSNFAVSVASVNNASCFGSCDGSVNLNITGGDAPYTITGDDFSYDFSGSTIDNNLFDVDPASDYDQNGQLTWNGNAFRYWNNSFKTKQTFSRVDGRTFTFRYRTGSRDSYTMIGWYGATTAISNSYQDLVHGIYFYGSNFQVREDGSAPYNRVINTNTWYEVRIELKSTGAEYYLKEENGTNFGLVYTSSSSTESDLALAVIPYSANYYQGFGAATDDWVVGASGASGGTSDTTNLCAGNYNLTVQDANGCSRQVSFSISEPAAALAASLNAGDSTCALQGYTVSAGNTTGGTSPYSYSFDMGDNTILTGSSVTHNYAASGNYTVSMTVTDANGCSETYSSNVFAEQCNVAPVAACQDITVYTDGNCQAMLTDNAIDNGSSDADGDVLVYALSNNGPFGVGTHSVTMTVTDPFGETDNCTAVVTVADNTNPTALAQDITVQLDASGNASIVAADVDNGSADNCGIASLSVSPSTFDCSNVGANTVTLTATDVNGNVSSGTATVTVEDNLDPVMMTQDITVQLDASGNASITEGDIDNGTFDNCAFALSLDLTSFDCSNVGANTVTLTATDVNGNVSSETAVVTVEDNVAPSAVAQDITVQLDASGNTSIVAADIDNGSSDACGIATLNVSPSAFNCANVGANTVTLTVTDVNGNVSAETAVVTVEDNIAPTITSVADISVVSTPSDCSPMISWTAPTGADNCSFTVSSTHNPGDRFNEGTTTVTYTATDASGNAVSTSFDVTVTPQPLTLSASAATYAGGWNVSCNGASDGSIDASVGGGCLPYSYSWSNGSTSEDVSSLPAGTYTLTVTDATGRTISTSVSISEPQPLSVSAAATGYNSGNGFSGSTIYLGYGNQSVNLDATAMGGTAGYNYSWSPSASLSSGTGASVVASPMSSTTYTVTVTDQNGCSDSYDVYVDVVDARCGKKMNKVLVCHKESKRKRGVVTTSYHNICVSANAVPAHLAHGDYLGPCNSQSNKRDVEESDEMAVTLYPNPTVGVFNVRIHTHDASSIRIALYSLSGQLIQTVSEDMIEGNNEYQLDLSNYATGIYMVRVNYGDSVENFKVIKE